MSGIRNTVPYLLALPVMSLNVNTAERPFTVTGIASESTAAMIAILMIALGKQKMTKAEINYHLSRAVIKENVAKDNISAEQEKLLYKKIAEKFKPTVSKILA